jgi:spore germination cell wall hydrolase CwlJ-like protein
MRPEHKKIFESLADWQLMGLCIEREAGGEPIEGKIAVGTVILERVDHRDWDGETIKEVILKRWQFSWTMPEAGEWYYNDAVAMASNWVDAYRQNESLKKCCDIATGMLQGEIPRDPDLAAVHCCQYLNPRVAPDVKEKWLVSGMKVIKKIGRHEFFKEEKRG